MIAAKSFACGSVYFLPRAVYRLLRVHSSWSLRHLWLLNDAITGGTAYHVGLHKTAADGGAAADADLFATSVDLSSAHVAPVDVLFEALDINTRDKRIWEVLGLTADPNIWYDLTLTGATVDTAAGAISVEAQWVQQV